MQKQVREFFKAQGIDFQKSKFLLAVSGGIDSMVLLDIFASMKLDFGVAHCNFKLRNVDSDNDEILVKSTAEKLTTNLHFVHFETAEYAQKNKIGIQEAARNLRYDFFHKITKEFDYQYIVTAHHANDNAETMIFNLISSTGIHGLKGIAPIQKNIIRPLLKYSKSTIEHYAKLKNIQFREDSSNESDKYSRNKIRLNVIPQLESINPKTIENINTTLSHFHELDDLFLFFVKNIKKNVLSEENNFIKINIDKLLTYPSVNTILFEILRNYGFSSAQSKEIEKALQEHHSGKLWFTQTHEMVLNRDFLIIREKKLKKEVFEYIYEDKNEVIIDDKIIKISTIEENKKINSKESINVDVTKLEFPLIIRRWKNGDYFLPLGLKGKRKKIQDFLTDLKLSRFEKEEVLVLESNGKIVWVIGLRADERFAASKDSLKIVNFSINSLAFL